MTPRVEGGCADVQITGYATPLFYSQPIYLPDKCQTGSTPSRGSRGDRSSFAQDQSRFVFKKQFYVPTARSLARAETVIVLAVEASPCSVSAEYSVRQLSRSCRTASPRLRVPSAMTCAFPPCPQRSLIDHWPTRVNERNRDVTTADRVRAKASKHWKV
jgi:hypothetical protein